MEIPIGNKPDGSGQEEDDDDQFLPITITYCIWRIMLTNAI